MTTFSDMITLKKLVEICSVLNEFKVKYVIIGGWAIFFHGYERTTRDIDVIIDSSPENIKEIKSALSEVLPEASRELSPQDLNEYIVVRMAGKNLIIDLIKSVGEMDYKKLKESILWKNIEGVKIPVAGLDALIELKKGVRNVDKRDYLFLIGKKQYLQNKKRKSE